MSHGSYDSNLGSEMLIYIVIVHFFFLMQEEDIRGYVICSLFQKAF